METVEKLGLETLIASNGTETDDTMVAGGGPGCEGRAALAMRRAASGGTRMGRNGVGGDAKSRSRNKARAVRPDLGTVLGSVPAAPVTKESQAPAATASSTLGTLSSLLFGRKGGLL